MRWRQGAVFHDDGKPHLQACNLEHHRYGRGLPPSFPRGEGHATYANDAKVKAEVYYCIVVQGEAHAQNDHKALGAILLRRETQ